MGFSAREKITNGAIFAWLIAMMVIPGISTKIKMALLFIMFFLVFMHHIPFRMNRKILFGVFVWELFFLFFLLNGIRNGFEFSNNLFEIYLVRPIVLAVLCTAVSNKNTFMLLIKMLVMVTFCIGVYNIIYMLGAAGIIPPIFVEKNKVIIIKNNFLSIRTSSQTALMLLGPFITTLFFNRHKFGSHLKRAIIAGFYLCLLVTVISGRRSLQIVFLIFFGMNYIYAILMTKTPRKARRKLFQASAFLAGTVLLCIITERMHSLNIVDAVWQTITGAFDPSAGSSIIRSTQMKYLLQYWKQRPVFGWGLTAYAREYIDWKYAFTGVMQKDLWSYEWFYIALLFQIGLVGIFLVLSVIFVMLKSIFNLYRANKSNELGIALIAIISGVLGFLIAGATNPMVTSTWMWFIFLGTYNFSLKMNND